MATYLNNLRLKEIATGDESGTWGTSTNTNLDLITDGFSYGTKDIAADADETFTMPDATADATRGFYLKFTSGVSLTATRTVTLGPNTVSKVWMIENATTGSQIITIKQGSGATVDVPSGSKLMVVTDGAGAGAAVLNANPTEIGGSVTSVAVTGTVNGITLTGGPVTSSGTFTLGGTLGSVDLTSQITGTLPIANGGTGSTSTTYASLTTNVTGTLPVANGGTGITSLGAGVADFLGTPSSANLITAVTDETGTGALVFATSPTLVTPTLGTPASVTLTNATGLPLATGVTGTLAIAKGGTGTTSTTYVNLNSNVTGTLPIAKGGTAATSAAAAATSLGVGTASNVQHGSLGIGTAASGTTGEIRATNNVTAYYSDNRLKTRLGPIENALHKVSSLSGFYYEANETAQALGYKVKREVGVSAQEVQAVLPEIVVPAPIDDKYLTVHYDKLVPLLIEAIKELSAKVETLENS